jgi:hypothetical protein
MPTDYDHEKWVELYKERGIPGLHAAELHAIDHAHGTLRFLEQEEERYAADEKRRAIEEALHKLRWIAPKIEKLK